MNSLGGTHTYTHTYVDTHIYIYMYDAAAERRSKENNDDDENTYIQTTPIVYNTFGFLWYRKKYRRVILWGCPGCT